MINKRPVILNAKQLRQLTVNRVQVKVKKIKKNEIYIVLDNVLDTYNIGSIFRLADAVSARKIYICGQSEVPPNHRIKKASINTTEVVEWEYAESAIEAIHELRTTNSELNVVAVEQSNKSVPYDEFDYQLPICLIVGHETDGVSKEALEIADAIVELPMFGINKSLNVMVSLGIILYEVIKNIKT